MDPRDGTSESAGDEKKDLPKSDLGILLSPKSYQSHIISNYIILSPNCQYYIEP